MKVKMFDGVLKVAPRARDYGFETLDEKVNAFLVENPNITIHHIKQSSSSSGDSDNFGTVTTVSIWYEEAD